MNKQSVLAIFTVILFCTLACSTPESNNAGNNTGNNNQPDIVNAASPRILTQPHSAEYQTGTPAAEVTALTVSVDPAGIGNLSYQWYRAAGTGPEEQGISLGAGARENSYKPEIPAAITGDRQMLYYYVQVTNTDNSVNGATSARTRSNTAIITVTREILHSIYDLNKDPVVPDSHAGAEEFSSLEKDYNSYVFVPAETLSPEHTINPVYARIKKTKSGDYLLFSHNNNIGMHIYYSRSSDLKNWSKGQYLMKAYLPQNYLPGTDNEERYHGADALVLDNGDIIAAFSFRPNLRRFLYPNDNGIMIKRSSDNGRTWSDAQVIYRGFNWEPFLLQLPSGRIQCYFTDGSEGVVTSEGGVNPGNSGTSIVYSDDNGFTWQPNSGRYPVIRQKRYTDNGKDFWTDQMPSVRLLNDGHSLVGIMEANVAPKGSSDDFELCLVYGQYNGTGNGWPHLSGNETGPADRTANDIPGTAGYITQFPSGETVISYTAGGRLSIKIGDSKGRIFNGGLFTATNRYQPFTTAGGWWGALELDDTHALLGTMHGKKSGSTSAYSDGIHVGRLILNHRIDAPFKSINVDGNNREWNHTDALFIGSESPCQTVFRAAYDAQNLYILAEQLNNVSVAGSSMQLYVRHHGSAIRIDLDTNGLVNTARWSSAWTDTEISGMNVVCRIPKQTGNSELLYGYLAELAIPLSAFNDGTVPAEDDFRFNAVTKNGGITDTFTFAEPNYSATWQRIRKE